jgi:hypothetical protein
MTMKELENFDSSDEDYAVESDFMPVFKKAQSHSFRPTAILWADTWIIPLQAKDGTFSFLLIDSLSYQTLNSQQHYLMGYSTAKEAMKAAHIYLGQCANKFLATFDMTSQKWPPLC